MATVFTDRFGFPLLTGGTDYPTPDTPADAKDINDQIRAIDAVMGFIVCTSGTRPSLPKRGQPIVETDTGNLLYYNGTTWVTITQSVSPVPVGTITPFGGSAAPTGYLLCDGSSQLRSTYAALFAVIGTSYGSVDGTHFNVPNAKGRSLVGLDATQTEFNALGKTGGAKTHTLTINEMPAHKHHTGTSYSVENFSAGKQAAAGSDGAFAGMGSAQALLSQGGGAAHNNLAPFLTTQYVIKAT